MLRKLLSEFLGTCVLVSAVVGSGTMATNLSSDRGVELVINTIATVLALAILIQLFGSISGAHFNPAVSFSDWIQKLLPSTHFLGYVIAQFTGGIAGVILANLMFKNPAIYPSHHVRSGANLLLAEAVATAGLVLIIQMLRGQNKTALAPVMIASWIGCAYFFTSSTSFANPAVTLARSFTDTFSGIAINSVVPFIFAQLLGAVFGTFLGHYFNYSREKETHG